MKNTVIVLLITLLGLITSFIGVSIFHSTRPNTSVPDPYQTEIYFILDSISTLYDYNNFPSYDELEYVDNTNRYTHTERIDKNIWPYGYVGYTALDEQLNRLYTSIVTIPDTYKGKRDIILGSYQVLICLDNYAYADGEFKGYELHHDYLPTLQTASKLLNLFNETNE